MSEIRISASTSLFFKGRPGDPRLGEWVKAIDSLAEISSSSKKITNVVILGCPDDTGVVANRGRAGAAGGPDSIRKYFYKMTPPMDLAWENRLAVFDYGNVKISSDILETHARTRTFVKEIVDRGAIPVLLGGGHDFAAPNFLGFADGQKKRNATLGLINVDPHLDVRPPENGKPHSGSPFRILLELKALKGSNFTEFGTSPNRNARAHFNFCEKNSVVIKNLFDLRAAEIPVAQSYRKSLIALAKKCDAVGVTFDMDACSESEGVSAPPVLGFNASELVAMASAAGAETKVRLMELAEVAPGLDSSERSSRIAAEMLFAFLRARAGQGRSKN